VEAARGQSFETETGAKQPEFGALASQPELFAKVKTAACDSAPPGRGRGTEVNPGGATPGAGMGGKILKSKVKTEVLPTVQSSIIFRKAS
jgi:hypothetical protein